MFCLAVVFLLRRADKSALVSLTIVYEGVKAKAAARTYTIYRSVGDGEIGNQENCLLSSKIVPGFFYFSCHCCFGGEGGIFFI